MLLSLPPQAPLSRRSPASTAATLARAYDDATESARLALELGNSADAAAHREVAEVVARHAAPRCLVVALMALSGVAS